MNYDLRSVGAQRTVRWSIVFREGRHQGWNVSLGGKVAPVRYLALAQAHSFLIFLVIILSLSGNLSLREVKVTRVVTLLVRGVDAIFKTHFQLTLLPMHNAFCHVIYTIVIKSQNFILGTFENRSPLKIIELGSCIIRAKVQEDILRPKNSF